MGEGDSSTRITFGNSEWDMIDRHGKVVHRLKGRHQLAVDCIQLGADKIQEMANRAMEEIKASYSFPPERWLVLDKRILSYVHLIKSDSYPFILDFPVRGQEEKEYATRVLGLVTEHQNTIDSLAKLLPKPFVWYYEREVDEIALDSLLDPSTYFFPNKPKYPNQLYSRTHLRPQVKARIGLDISLPKIVTLKYIAIGYGKSKLDIVCKITENGIKEIEHYHLEYGAVKDLIPDFYKASNISNPHRRFGGDLDHMEIKRVTGTDIAFRIDETVDGRMYKTTFSFKEWLKSFEHQYYSGAPMFLGGEAFEFCVAFCQSHIREFMNIYADAYVKRKQRIETEQAKAP